MSSLLIKLSIVRSREVPLSSAEGQRSESPGGEAARRSFSPDEAGPGEWLSSSHRASDAKQFALNTSQVEKQFALNSSQVEKQFALNSSQVGKQFALNTSEVGKQFALNTSQVKSNLTAD